MYKQIFFSRFYLLLFCCIFLVACKKKDITPDPYTDLEPAITAIGTPVGAPVAKSIGSAGGSLISPDGRLELKIPAGALNSSINITIQPVTNEAPGGLGLAYDLLPNGTKFSKPATIIFHYTDDVDDYFPYFSYIAYQDSSNMWVADEVQRDFDTVAKTVSLEISHFTIWAVGTIYYIGADPWQLEKNQTSRISAEQTIRLDRSGKRSPLHPVPHDKLGTWKVNGRNGGNDTDGRISGSGATAVYVAPARIDNQREVRVSTTITTHTVYKKGIKIIEFKHFERGTFITLNPFHEYNYKITIEIRDSVVSPFYGGYMDDRLPIYIDEATFDLNVKVEGHSAYATVTNIVNNPPRVTRPTQSLDSTTFTWLADPFGQMNITGLLENRVDLPEDSVLLFSFKHNNASHYGFILEGEEGVHVESPPNLYGGNEGFPHFLELDLKRKEAYIKTTGNYGQYIRIFVVPK